MTREQVTKTTIYVIVVFLLLYGMAVGLPRKGNIAPCWCTLKKTWMSDSDKRK
jgi:hypothetical protein